MKTDLDAIAHQSREVAAKLDNVLSACLAGDILPSDAARIGYVGMGIAANNAVHLHALRLSNGTLSRRAWAGIR